MTNTALMGVQWGDEGKGKIIDVLAESHDVVVRYQGGGNAGHTVKIGEELYVLHLLPSGILRAEKVCVLGNGEIMNWKDLDDEVSGLEERGIEVGERLKISDRMHVIFPYHKILDIASDFKKGIGTTGRGIGPTYEAKAARTGLRANLFRSPQRVEEELLKQKPFLDALVSSFISSGSEANRLERTLREKGLDQYYGLEKGFNIDLIAEEANKYARRFVDNIIDVTTYLHTCGKSILFEGAQGVSLDIDFGSYPFVTSSNASSAGVHTGTGYSLRNVDDVVGVLKAYTTRVGEGPMPTELLDETGERLRSVGREFGATTGRPRRCGWEDLVQIRYNTMIGDVDYIALTKLDVLTGIDPIKFCVAYELGGGRIEHVPADIKELARCKPIYEELPGWHEDIRDARSFRELPSEARDYVVKLIVEAERHIKWISVGKGRDQTFEYDP